MVMYGADVAELRALAARMDDAAASLRSISGTLQAEVTQARWDGPDAGMFLQQWNRTHRTQLLAVVEALGEAGDRLERNAADQERTSGATGGSSIPDPCIDPDAGDDLEIPGWLRDLLDDLGLGREAIKTLLDLFRSAFGDDAFSKLGDMLSPALVSGLKALDVLFDVAGVVMDLATDFLENIDLPIDERIVHALGETAVRFALDAGVDEAAKWLGGIIGSPIPVVGPIVGVAAGCVIGHVLGEALDALNNQFGIIDGGADAIADLLLESYRFHTDPVGQMERIIDILPIDIPDIPLPDLPDLGGFLPW